MFSTAYRLGRFAAAALLPLVLVLGLACSGEDDVILATTTSTQDSGLLDVLVPAFEEATGYHLKTIAVGTGQALEMGRRGDADTLLVHSPVAEEEFIAEGYGTNRQLVMHNDFVLLGPAGDPAAIGEADDALAALRAIAANGGTFVSRGDDSGTHKLELALWSELAIDPAGASWYRETGQGMGATLQVANQLDAYTMSDRATYLALLDLLDLEILQEGDPRLLNIYHVMQVNPDRHGAVNGEGARAFVEFMVSDEAQAIIAAFGIEEFGQPLFIPDAGLSEADLGGT